MPDTLRTRYLTRECNLVPEITNTALSCDTPTTYPFREIRSTNANETYSLPVATTIEDKKKLYVITIGNNEHIPTKEEVKSTMFDFKQSIEGNVNDSFIAVPYWVKVEVFDKPNMVQRIGVDEEEEDDNGYI